MANVEKMLKAFEALKTIQPPTAVGLADELTKKKDGPLSKKDKVTHCCTIADAICSPNVRAVSDFNKFLGIALETFFLCCDDDDSDVRMIADECLNRTIKTLMETHLGRLHVELYKEIKKDGPARSLRAALSRFADLAHLIRPQRCKPYVINLFPCLEKICRRTEEESVQETLGIAMGKIMPVLGKYTSENEITTLLKAFLPNLNSTLASVRRTAALSLGTICQHSRKPATFFAWLLNSLLEMVIPVQSCQPVHTLLGVLLCIRHLIPHLNEEPSGTGDVATLKSRFGTKQKKDAIKIDVDQLLQVYELLLHYLQHDDHNVVTASLESLQQIFRTPPKLLVPILLSPSGISKSYIHSADSHLSVQRQHSGNFMMRKAAMVSSTEDDSFLDSDDQEIAASGRLVNDVASLTISESRHPPVEDAGGGFQEFSDTVSSHGSVIGEDNSDYSDIIVDKAVTTDDGSFNSPGVHTFAQKPPSLVSSVTSLDGQDSPSHDRIPLRPLKPLVGLTPTQGSPVHTTTSNEGLSVMEGEQIPLTPSSGEKLEFSIGNIGSYTDQDIPLKYCTRYLCSSFLLTGCKDGLMPDTHVRVSVKSLAMSCLSGILSLYPEVFFQELHRSYGASHEDAQRIWDIILYTNHPDPQLKGHAAILLSNFLRHAIRESSTDWDSWVQDCCDSTRVPSLEDLVSRLLAVTLDESSIASRMGLVALRQSLAAILESVHGCLGLRVLDSLLNLKNNPYWLVKVGLVELLAEVPFKVVNFLESSSSNKDEVTLRPKMPNCQERCIEFVMVPLLGDEDPRVRQAAATSLVKMLPKLFFPIDHVHQDSVTALAKDHTRAYLGYLVSESPQMSPPLIHGLIAPFSQKGSQPYCSILEGSLSRIVALLSKMLLMSKNKYLVYGSCQALDCLSEEYMVTVFTQAWSMLYGEKNSISRSLKPMLSRQTSIASVSSFTAESGYASADVAPTVYDSDILCHLISLVSSTPVMLELDAHQHALHLAGNLMSGASLRSLQPRDPLKGTSSLEEDKWGMLRDKHLISIIEELFTHVMRLLNIFNHVLEDLIPAATHSRSALSSLANPPSLSPIKRKTKAAAKDADAISVGSTGTLPGKSSPIPPGQAERNESDKDKTSIKSTGAVGQFFSIPPYMKLYDMLKSIHSSYKISNDFQSNEKFLGLLRVCLDVLSQILEIGGLAEMGKCAEEILKYLKTAIALEPCGSIQCVRQLLKALFGTNLASLWEGGSGPHASSSTRKPGRMARLATNTTPGLYYSCFSTPYAQFTQCLANSTLKPAVLSAETEEMGSWLSWMRRRSERKLTSLLKTGSKDEATLTAHIRLFEPVVFKALRQYTVTSNVQLQCQVLDMLSQLVQLGVNYCLLDSDEVFIGFVKKQFEFIEEGQIINAECLIPAVFYFLVLLSYERHHSKSIIGVSDIIQLCDGLMASGQPPDKCAIPALQPIVEDLFLLRGLNKVDSGKELDTQREFVVSMLLRLVQFTQVLDMFLIILHQSYKEGEDKWKKLSRQIIDVVLPMLARQQLHVDNQESLTTLHNLFEAVSASVFRPVDILLKALFSRPQGLSSKTNLHRWMSLVLSVIHVLISQAKEEVVLTRLGDLNLTISVPKHFSSSESHVLVRGGSVEIGCLDADDMPAPEEVFARFLLQVVGVVVEAIHHHMFSPLDYPEDCDFLCQQLARFLLYLMHMFQSGIFRRVATSAMAIVKGEDSGHEGAHLVEDEPQPGLLHVSKINSIFLDLTATHPTLVLQWCNILILLNYDNQAFWSKILNSPHHHHPHPQSSKSGTPSCSPKPAPIGQQKECISANLEMVRRGGLILLCDYMCENLNDAEQMTWLIVNHVNELIPLSDELPVQDFISAVQRNPAASGLLVQAVHSRCNNITKPHFVKQMLHCLEAIHASQSGSLIALLVDKFLLTHHLAISRIADSLACRRLEMLLAETPGDAASQLPVEDIIKLIQVLKKGGNVKWHQRLISLLEKLKTTISGRPSSPMIQHPLSQPIPRASNITINKEWYLSQVKKECFKPNASAMECALLLSQLTYEDALSIMVAKDFYLPILEKCICLGVQLMSEADNLLTASTHQHDLQFVAGSGNNNNNNAIHHHPLYRAGRETLLQHITHLVSLLPHPHQTFLPHAEVNTPKEAKYRNRLIDLFADPAFWEVLFQVIPSLSQYLTSLKLIPGQPEVPVDSLEDVARFCILCTETIQWMIESKDKASCEHLHLALNAVNECLKNINLSAVIGLQGHMTWTCSAVTAVHNLVLHLLGRENIPKVSFLRDGNTTESTPEIIRAQKACAQMSELIAWLEHIEGKVRSVPSFIFEPLQSTIIGIARLPLVNSYVRTPPVLWTLGWNPGLGGDFKTLVPPPPGEYLQERDVLKQYIYRINLLGWISRQQFEETWMALLGVLSTTPLGDTDLQEEDQDWVQTSCLGVKSITSLLLQTLLLPQPGNPQNSVLLRQPRDKPLAFLHTRCGKKLHSVSSPIHKKIQALIKREETPPFTVNMERVASQSPYSLGLVSLEYLCVAAGLLDDIEEHEGCSSSSSSPVPGALGGAISYHQREQSLSAAGLDIHSCLHFLLDLYSQWLSVQACPRLPLTLLTEVARSVVILSDIFMERSQYEWMLDTLLELHRVHPAEDEILAQYLIIGICKATAVLGMEQDMLEQLKKLVELSLRSTFLPTRIATLYGLLYLLEQGDGDDQFPLLPAATDYLMKHLDYTPLQSEEHTLAMWSVAFYIIENYQDDISATEFGQKIFQLCLNVCSITADDSVPTSIYLTVLNGLERLLLAQSLSNKEAGMVLKLAVDWLRHGSPLRALAALETMLSCMYIGKGSENWSSGFTSRNASIASSIEGPGDASTQTDSEQLIAALERMTVLFDRIKRGFPFEAEVICQIIPNFLLEFFPVQDVLNKVIGEFLSSQQPYPQFMAKVVFQVFEHLHSNSQEDLIHDWVLLSLSNFTQRSPVSMAVWSLSCFFISASANTWIRSLFPHVQNRMGKMEDHDRELFCLAGLSFRNHLKREDQRQTFLSIIQSVALPDTPYADLMSCL